MPPGPLPGCKWDYDRLPSNHPARTWPFARLQVGLEQWVLTISVFGIFEIANYTFTPDQIVSIDVDKSLFVGYGIHITHTVANYPDRIAFWFFSGTFLAAIVATGFPFESKLRSRPEVKE